MYMPNIKQRPIDAHQPYCYIIQTLPRRTDKIFGRFRFVRLTTPSMQTLTFPQNSVSVFSDDIWADSFDRQLTYTQGRHGRSKMGVFFRDVKGVKRGLTQQILH